MKAFYTLLFGMILGFSASSWAGTYDSENCKHHQGQSTTGNGHADRNFSPREISRLSADLGAGRPADIPFSDERVLNQSSVEGR